MRKDSLETGSFAFQKLHVAGSNCAATFSLHLDTTEVKQDKIAVDNVVFVL